MSITQDELKELLHYDPETGVFTWNITTRGKVIKGNVAGYRGTWGYICITLRYKHYRAHRLAWLYVTGRLPKHQIDHINGDRLDNRLCNLREATNTENRQNVGKQENNISGFTGVSWDKRKSKWRATIQYNRKHIFLGYFTTPELAYEAYLKAKEQYHTFNPTVR